jgi:hypothetical protein
MKTYSTVQVAKILGVGTDTLHRWMLEKKVPVPPLQSVGRMSVRLWSDSDVQAAKKYKVEHYWGRGARRQKTKQKK